MNRLRSLAALLAIVALAGCADPRGDAERLATGAGFSRQEIDAAPFRLLAYARARAPTAVLRIYIEGDGYAWRTREDPSDDPTPRDPVALRLAAADPGPAVAYLARPCQYISAAMPCHTGLWTNARYSAEVIDTVAAAASRLAAMVKAERLELVGYSGGGVVAALVAARRTDVASLRTVAAPLDTAGWTARHGLSPLRGSRNPADMADRLAGLPQIHFVGAEDSVVAEADLRGFARRMGPTACLRVSVLPGQGHGQGWAELWPRLLPLAPRCGG